MYTEIHGIISGKLNIGLPVKYHLLAIFTIYLIFTFFTKQKLQNSEIMYGIIC